MEQEPEEEEIDFSILTDEALLMADEILSKNYPLPDKITEESIREEHRRIKILERYAETTLL